MKSSHFKYLFSPILKHMIAMLLLILIVIGLVALLGYLHTSKIPSTPESIHSWVSKSSAVQNNLNPSKKLINEERIKYAVYILTQTKKEIVWFTVKVGLYLGGYILSIMMCFGFLHILSNVSLSILDITLSDRDIKRLESAETRLLIIGIIFFVLTGSFIIAKFGNFNLPRHGIPTIWFLIGSFLIIFSIISLYTYQSLYNSFENHLKKYLAVNE